MQRWATSNAFHIHFFWQKGESMIWCIETLACWEENSFVHFNCRANLACRGKKGNIAGMLVEIVVDYHLATPRLDTVTCIALIKYEMTTCPWCAANALQCSMQLVVAKLNLGKEHIWKRTFVSCNIVQYICLFIYSFIQHPHAAKTFSNCVPGDTHNLQRSTRYQFSSVRYYILSYCQQYISRYDSNHLEKVIQNEFKITLRMIALFEYSSQ